jgi:GT2 family glycosyltransferase
MKVAVIVVNYNDVEDTLTYVKEITKYDVINKIVVVDNQSTTIGALENLRELRDEKVDVIEAPLNGGYSYGNNYGVKHLNEEKEEYDYIIFSNPDITISKEAIENSLKVLEEDKNVAVVAPRMFNKDERPIRRSSWKVRTFLRDVVHSTRLLEILFYFVLRNGEYKEEDYKKEKLEVEAISGAFFIMRKSVYDELGPFDEETFLFYEEDILAIKLKEKGYKTISLNTDHFIHYESQSIGKAFSYYKKLKRLYNSKIYYHTKYNNMKLGGKIIFGVLNICRKIELLVEIPTRKLLKK